MLGRVSTPSLARSDTAGAIIVAAGESRRMAGVNKLLAPLAGVPLVARAVEAFEASSAVGAIVVVVSARNVAAIESLHRERGWRKVAKVCLGGARRQDSVRNGLSALPACGWVLVHDGARPLVAARLITSGLQAARATGAAIPVVPLKDTIKILDAGGDVVETLDRATLGAVQTPQVFRRTLLERAHREVTADVTDDAAMVETLGVTVRTFAGDPANIKVTTPDDLAVAAALADDRSSARGEGTMARTREITAVIEREGDGYVALCSDLDIASQGPTIEEARRNLAEAVELFFGSASPSEVRRRLHSEVYVTRLNVRVA